MTPARRAARPGSPELDRSAPLASRIRATPEAPVENRGGGTSSRSGDPLRSGAPLARPRGPARGVHAPDRPGPTRPSAILVFSQALEITQNAEI
jgi:hypothetical protein